MKRLLAGAVFLALAPSLAAAFTPTEDYDQKDIRGFTVLVSPEVKAQPGQEADALSLISLKLGDIERLLPASAVDSLKQVKIWVEWQEEPVQASTYNPSADWLTEHGRNPDKEKGVEVTNLPHFLAWGRSDQPMILLHELSHAYHDNVLSYDDARILDAYKNAVDKGLYLSVPYVHGGNKRAYALTNEKEFFAELSEAYWGKNDFFPFTRAELMKYDPVGYEMVKDCWGR